MNDIRALEAVRSIFRLKRIARSLSVILILSIIQIVSGPALTNSSVAYTRGNSTLGTAYGNSTGGVATTPAECANGAISGFGVSSTLDNGSYATAFGYTCKTIAVDGSVSAASATTTINPLGTPNVTDNCSATQVAHGLQVTLAGTSGGSSASGYMAGIGLICGNVMTRNSPDTRTIFPTDVTYQPTAATFTYTCPTGNLLVGFALRQWGGIDQLRPKCAPFTNFVYAAISTPSILSSGPHTASISFTGVSTNILETALSYTVTAVPTSGPTVTATGSSSPISLTSLGSNMPYTITVTGSNTYGSSAATGNVVLSSALLPGSDTDSALTLNGTSQYAQVVDSNDVDFPAGFTVSAWINPTQISGDHMIVAKDASIQFYIQNGVFGFSAMSTTSPTWTRTSTGIAARLNEWQHIAYTRLANETDYNFYFNGYLVSNFDADNLTSNNAPVNSDSRLTIGGRAPSNGITSSLFSGQIDHVSIFNTARTLSQIQSDMNSYTSPSTSNLLMSYDFNEGSGTTIYNRRTGASATTDLTLFGTPTFTDVKNNSTFGAYTVVSFPRTYITVNGGFKMPSTVSRASVLAVAGGGGGGSRHGGGGGAGGLAYGGNYPVSPSASYSIVVGTGGVGYGRPGNNAYKSGATFVDYSTAPGGGMGSVGSNSLFKLSSSNADSITALGGGGGSGSGAAGAGGSGGGSNQNIAGGTTTQFSGTNWVGYGNPGGRGASGSCSTDWCGGGGGGAGTEGAGLDGNLSSSGKAGNGGTGRAYSFESAVLTDYAGGGGGASLNGSADGGLGGNGGGGNGGTAAAGTSGATSTGGGGGGGGHLGNSDYAGGNGGSGIVMVRWITATKPNFSQPTNDTTTAGITDTITVSNNPTSQLVRGFRWQYSSDTGTSWINLETGTGFTSNTYTTPILETNTSGIRYQYRVVVTDSDTAGLSIVDTSTAVFIVINPRITFSGTFTSQKYGDLDSDTFTVLNGTGNKSFVYSPGNRPGITWSSPSANTAVVTVARTVSPGTYPETITATDTRGAQTQLLVSVVVTKADTITVTALARSDTYTGSALSFTPSFTAVGLKNSDTVTPVVYNYNGADNAGITYSTSTTKPMNAGSYIITPSVPASLTDSYTAVTIVTGALTINRATRTITMTAPTSPLKYGDTRTAVATASAGSGDGTISYLTSTSDSCTVTSTTIRAVRSAGTCSFTAMITRGNNFETATTASAVTTTLTKADTITVQVRNPFTLTYTANQAASVPTLNIVGLVHTDSATATRLYSHPASVVGAPESYAALTNNATIPTDVETYTVSATDLTFSSGLASNYQNIVKETSTLTINQANQQPLRIAMYGAFVGSSYTITTDGGSGIGLITETITAGSSASNCLINARVLTITSTVQSFCNILVTKAATRNFKVETATAQITFYLFIPTVSAPAQGSGPTVALTSENAVTVDAVGAPTITGISHSVISLGAGGSFTITGTGFGSIPVTVKFWRDKSVTITPTNGSTIIVPVADIAAANGQSGRITLINAGGTAISVERLTINP